MRLSVLGVGSKNSPKTRKNTPKWVKISIFFPKSPQNPPENGFGGGSGQFSALISGKTSKIVVKFRGGGVLRIDPHSFCTLQELATAVQELKSRQHTIEMDHLKACFLEQGEADDVSDSTSVLSGDTPASNAEISANKKRIRELLGTKCMVCGSEKDVAVAHILKKASHCQSFMAYYDKNSKDMSNWLMLCGTRGKVNACHHLFDSYEMGFCMKDGEWYAYGGVKDGEQVALRSNPHRTVLQAHLAMVMKNLEEKKQANEAVLAWSKDVSQSTPPAQGTGSM